ncbi:hypothetical protein BVRB_3g060940 [Beta vulgaris subsp. vulgaris]|nr:hypothetical protein BVRB_3g060940 [Beta vulgaris subsp. vulgaris]
MKSEIIIHLSCHSSRSGLFVDLIHSVLFSPAAKAPYISMLRYNDGYFLLFNASLQLLSLFGNVIVHTSTFSALYCSLS